jgi:hypothetical protein
MKIRNGFVSNSSSSSNSNEKTSSYGDLFVVSKKEIKRFDGSFKEYKKIIMKNLDNSLN